MSKTIPLYGIKIETNVGYYVWLTATGTSPLRKKAKKYDTRAGAVADRNALAESSPSVKLIVEKLDKENPVKMRAVKAKIMREKTASKENPPASEVTENVTTELGTDTESLPMVKTPPEGTSKAEEPAEEKAPEVENPKESDPDAETAQESVESAPQREAVTEA